MDVRDQVTMAGPRCGAGIEMTCPDGGTPVRVGAEHSPKYQASSSAS